jgi:hypothetical protein
MRKLIVAAITFLLCQASLAQGNSATLDKFPDFPSSFFNTVNKKTTKLQAQLTKDSEKYLLRLAKREKKLQRKLSRIDSTAAKELFGNSGQQYRQMADAVKGKINAANAVRGQYIPYLDSLKTSLSFLGENNTLLSNSKELDQKIKGSLANVSQLQGKLQQTEAIKAFIQQRKQQIKEALSKYSRLPKGLTKNLAGFNKQAYYYGAQLNEFKEILKDSKKAEKKAIELISTTKAFKDFMRKNSQLASLFAIPGSVDDPLNNASLAGLQTRAQVTNLIQTQIAAGGPNAQQQFRESLQQVQSELDKLKEKVLDIGGNTGNDELPDFKPNDQKTKSFFKRLEYGTNIQTQQANNFFPATTDIGLSAGYKLNDKSIIGIGASYKLGMGRGWNDIRFTHQGMGLRTFIDWKIKGSFYLSGGFEQNFRPSINGTIPPLPGTGAAATPVQEGATWQQSGLIGMSKVISLKSKFFKKTKMQLLWDMLSYQQSPRTQAVVFRIGYSWQ